MTYEEALKDSFEKVDICGKKMRTLELPYFLTGFSTLLCLMAQESCSTDCPVMIGPDGKYVGGGKANEYPSAMDIMRVLSGNDFVRSATLTQSLIEFLNWFLEQEITEDDEDYMWYDCNNIIDEWNEFVKEKRKGATE